MYDHPAGMGRQVCQYLCMHPAGQQRSVPVVGWGYSPCQFAIPGSRVQRPVVSGHHGERHSDGELRLKRRLTPRSPSQGFSPERQICGFKIHFTHTRKISSEWEICVFRVFCVRKKYQRENRNIFHTEFTEPTELFLRNEQNMCYHTGIRIHRICRRLRHDGWRGGNENKNENRKYFYLTHLNKAV